jgi:hypothetical protein
VAYDEWRTSDEILDLGKEGLTFFADFIPVYNEACAAVGGGRYAGISHQTDIQKPFDDLRGIDFSMLRADAEHLRAAVESAENHQHNLDRYWGSLGGWSGAASTAARSHHDRFNGMAAGFLQGAGPVPAAITGAVRNIQDTLLRYTDNLNDLSDQKCGGMTPEEVRGAIRTAQGDIEGMESARFLSKVLDVGSGFVTFGAGWLLDYFGYGASDQVEELRQELMRTARESLRNFIDEFDAKKAAFDGYTKSAAEAVQRDYDTMIAGMKPLTAEAFKDLPDPRNFQDSTTPAGTTQGARRQPPAVPSGRTTAPSGAGAPTGGPSPTHPPTTVPSGQTTQPTATVPPVPPVTTQPPATTGLPGQGQPQPVTIPNGNGSISVTPPDAQGRVRLTTNDGVNPPKTYDLDFNRGTSASGIGGANQVGGIGQSVPPVPPPAGGGVAAPGSGIPGIPPVTPIGGARSGSSGGGGSPTAPAPRLPSSLFPWSDKPAPGLSPDEDGKFTIRDGDVTITVDADEATDQLKITLDDGHGHQTSYSVDYKDPAHPTLHQGAVPEPHVFGPTGSTPAPQSSFSPSGASVGHLGGGGGGGFGGGAGGLSSVPGGGGLNPGGQLEPDAYSGQSSGSAAPAAGTTAPAAASAGASGQARGGGSMGMPMMGGMGMGAGGAEDKERGPNRWLGKDDVISDDPAERRRAVKAGGVIGEDGKKK